MRKRALLSLSLPLAAAGSLAGHSLGYAIAGAGPEDARVHGYLSLAPRFLAACVALTALSLALRLTGRLGGRLSAWPFAVVPPLAFATQELVERLAAGLPAHAVLEPAVFAGLAAQVPVAAAAYLVARALLRVADATADALAPRSAIVLRAAPLPAAARAVAPPRVRGVFDRPGRAPPGR